MGFVNEYVSDEDIDNYGLKEIWDTYKPLRRGRYFGGQQPEWTIDKHRKVFLYLVEYGVGETGNEAKFVLSTKSGWNVFVLRQQGGSKELADRPFLIRWQLVGDRVVDRNRSEVLDLLKEALRVRGYWGIEQQVPETVVNYDF